MIKARQSNATINSGNKAALLIHIKQLSHIQGHHHPNPNRSG
jgi:hypothetical protein